MKEKNGFKEKWRILGGHRVKIIVPPDKPLEERIKGLERLAEKMRNIAIKKGLGRSH